MPAVKQKQPQPTEFHVELGERLKLVAYQERQCVTLNLSRRDIKALAVLFAELDAANDGGGR